MPAGRSLGEGWMNNECPFRVILKRQLFADGFSPSADGSRREISMSITLRKII